MFQKGQYSKSQDRPLFLQQAVRFLEPFKRRFKSLAVESTYNWYWLVDGLRALSYPVVLANPAQIDQYSGIKHADDKNDAFFLTERIPRTRRFEIEQKKRQDRISHFKAVIGKQPEEERTKTSGRTTFYLLTSRPNGRPLSYPLARRRSIAPLA